MKVIKGFLPVLFLFIACGAFAQVPSTDETVSEKVADLFSNYELEGASDVEAAAIDEVLKSYKGVAVTEKLLKKITDDIRHFYLAKNYPNAKVDIKQQKGDNASEFKLVITIDRGKEAIVSDGAKGSDVIDYATTGEYTIGGITVSVDGSERFDENRIIMLSGLKVGSAVNVPGDDFSRAINNLWDQKLFSDIKITQTKITGETIFLNIFVKERGRISRYKFNGVSKSEADNIRELLDLYSGKLVTENLIMNTNNTVRNYFLDKRYLRVKADVIQKRDTVVNNGIILTINVKKGEKHKIKEINVTGSDSELLSSNKLKRAMKDTKQKRWWSIFKASKYNQTAYQRDKQALIAKFNEKGFRDAKIESDTVYFNDDNTVSIDINIDQGGKYYFRNITWVGNGKYRSGQLDTILGIKSGDTYNQSLLESRLYMNPAGLDITSLYMDDGYLFFSLNPVEIQVENDSIDIEMRISEGKQARVNKVIIKGNTKTNDHVIMREIRTRPGDLFNRKDIIRTQRELAQLGYFNPEAFQVNPIPHPETGTVDIEYTLEEKPSDQIELSGGWGAGRIVGTLGLSFSNFSVRNIFKKGTWRPLPAGDGQRLSIRAQSNGLFFQSYNLSFTEPWLGGKKPMALSVSAFQSVQSNGLRKDDPLRTSIKITGASIGLGKRLKWPDDYFTLYTDLSYQYYDLNNFGSVFTFSNGFSNNISVRASLSRNSIDDPLYSRAGSSITLTAKLTPPYSYFRNVDDYSTWTDQEKFKWLEYNKVKFTTSWFTALSKNRKLVLNTRTGFGFLNTWNKDLGASPFERFYLGGSGLTGFNLDGREIIALRGYNDGAVAPSTGGLLISKYTVELRYPLSLNPSATIYCLGFLEAGNTWDTFKEYNPFEVKRSAGVGVRIFLPMFGLMGLDYGWGFDSVETDPFHQPGAGQFHFTIGMNLGEL
jgi:outer membrane protein insertion porin family